MTMTTLSNHELPQWGDPHGVWGRIALMLMAAKNGGNNRAALKALALRKGEKVLEVGVGPGLALKHALRRVGRPGFVGGVDHARLAAMRSKRRLRRAIAEGRASVHHASVAELPFEDGFFDAAFAVNSFQFWPDPIEGLAEIGRTLKPGGRLVITQRAANGEVKNDFAGASGGWARIDRAADCLPAAGFEVVEVTDVPVGRLIAASILARKMG